MSNIAYVQDWKSDEIKSLFKELTKCSMVLKTYGKQIDVDKFSMIFIEVLKDFKPDQVIEALKYHIANYEDFPAPVHIKNIITNKTKGRDAPNQWIYQELCHKRRAGQDLTLSEEEYKKSYERFYIEGKYAK